MDATYQAHGVRFRYPGEWELSEQQDPEQLSITVASPATAFWTLSLFASCPDPEDVIETVLDAFREEYDELDEYPADEKVGRRAAIGRDIDFVCLDKLNLAAVRSFRTRQFTALVLFQLTEAEREEIEPILERMTASLTCGGARGATAESDDE